MDRRIVPVAALAFAVATLARSGHELPIYPSYYPHEIELRTVSAEDAGTLLAAGKIQALVGSAANLDASGDRIDSVESLGSFVLVRLNPASSLLAGGRSACDLSDALVRGLDAGADAFVLHPYPVTPFHGDYLHHSDRAEAAKARALDHGGRLPDSDSIRVRGDGAIARSLIRPEWRARGADWDAEVVEVPVADLIAPQVFSVNGWSGPAWLKAGWFHAALLLEGSVNDEERRRRIASDQERLRGGDYADAVQRINLERSVVAALTEGCQARVAGYSVKRESFSTVFTAGVENLAYDSLAGLNSPMFLRTVKLRDFPWNGWLTLGIGTRPQAAWNPIAGFTDDFGRLLWSAVGDPALLPSPYEAAWMLNRITDVRSRANE